MCIRDRFWANHFTVSLGKGSTTGLVGAFEREAVRPHIAGRFADLLAAAVTHPAMLRYLDNHLSAGPQSRVVLRLQRRAAMAAATSVNASAGADALPPPRLTGLNENLAREVLELHTLGVTGGGDQPGAEVGLHQGAQRGVGGRAGLASRLDLNRQRLGQAGQSGATLGIGRPDLRLQPAARIGPHHRQVGLTQAEAVGGQGGIGRG